MHLLIEIIELGNSLLEEQNVQQHGTVWTTDDHLPIVSSVVECLVV